MAYPGLHLFSRWALCVLPLFFIGCDDAGETDDLHTQQVGESCETHDDCVEEAICRGSVCRLPCAIQSDCPDDESCLGGTCLPLAPPVCGDGVVEGLEACDPGGETATCDFDCTSVSCGDGTLNSTAGESCDDGWESVTCNADCTAASCGDGKVNATAGEACDGGIYCGADCQWASQPECDATTPCPDPELSAPYCHATEAALYVDETHYTCDAGSCVPTTLPVLDEVCASGEVCAVDVCVSDSVPQLLFDTVDPYAFGTAVPAADPAAAQTALDGASPGDAIVLADGSYADVALSISASGTATEPIILRPETPGGVVFTGSSGGNPSIEISGDYVIVAGFVFDTVSRYTELISFSGAHFSRATEIVFFNTKLSRRSNSYACNSGAITCLDANETLCGTTGNGEPTCNCAVLDDRGNCQREILFLPAKVANFENGAQDSRLDHSLVACTWGSSLGVEVRSDDLDNKRNVIDHNSFFDMVRTNQLPDSKWEGDSTWNEGEPIQLGYGDTALALEEMETLVYANLFDDAWSDPEIISSKSSRNDLRNNTVINIGMYLALRAGAWCEVSGNLLFDGAHLRVRGHEHLIVNNYVAAADTALTMETGDDVAGPGSLRNQVHDTLVVHNTLVASNRAIRLGGSSEPTDTFVPTDNTFANNLLIASGTGAVCVAETESSGTVWATNIAHATGGATVGVTDAGLAELDPLMTTVSVGGMDLSVIDTGSPAEDLGGDYAVARDAFDNLRDASPDLGHYELGGATTPPAPLSHAELLPAWMDPYFLRACDWN